MDWFRSWHGAPTDTKWLVIARKANVAPGLVSAVAWALMDYASQNEDRGSVAGFDVETYATFAGWDEEDITAVIAAMHAKGIIDEHDRLSAWEKRQPKREDDSTERVRNWRARNATPVPEQNETQCNAEKHDVTQSNAPDKIKSRTDTEHQEPPADPNTQAIRNAYDACGLLLSKSHLDKHLETITRTGLVAWQLGFAEALKTGKHNVPNYVARCAESAMIAAQHSASGNGTNKVYVPEKAAEVF